VLLVLRRFAPQRERDMIDAIRDRRLFKRLYVLTHSKEQQAFDAIYQRFYQYRLDGKLKELEDWRVDCERAIRDKVLAALSDTLKGRSSEDAREIELRIKSADPLILIDVPVKAVTRSIESESIWYIPEDIGGVKPQNAVNQLAIRPVALQQTPFDKAVGKIRLFSPPDLKDIMLSCITEHHDEITKILAH
jgi:hypothetical protein